MSILFITQQKYDHINFMAIDTSFEHYAVSHDKNGTGGGSTVIRGNIKNTNIPSDLQVTSITAARGNINNLHGTTVGFNDAEFVYLTTSEGKILKIKGDELNYTIGSIDELKSGKITTDSIKTNDLYSTNAVIDALNSTNITTEYLTVTKQAHFFELVIDKVKSVGGSLIITGANSVIAYVKAFDSNNVEVPMFDSNGDPIAESTINSAAAYFKVYWIGKDENTGRENEDEWYVGDQAYCQSFNVHEGTNFNASNKYYWRKVIGHESPVYMNLKTGEELQSGQSELYNEVYINTPTLSYTVNGTTYNVNKGWNVAVQQMSEVTWTPDSSVVDGTTCGTMGTKGTTFGIQLTPNTSTGSIQNIVPETFSFTCDKARLGVGFVYQDGSYEWFAAPEQGQTSYVFSLTTSTPIDAIIIINNDTVEWKLVRGIRLSNIIKDSNLARAASIPSIGDNIAQLGHRYNEADSELGQNTPEAQKRASAIIIAAYHTPDKGETINGTFKRGLTPPSYAQYKLINDFYLTRFRHTFFDAEGSAFYGDFYAGSDNSGYNELEAGTPELFVAYAEDNGQGQADPNHWTKTPVINVTYDFMGYATATVPPGGTRAAVEQTLQFSDYDWSMVPSATSTNGINGSYTQYAYKNAVSAPSTPSSTSTYPPTGWTKTASTPSDGQYTWCIERTIVYDTNNTIDYTQCSWSSAYRISGSNGQQGPQGLTGPQGTDGSDGTDFEFIYTRNNDGTVPTAPVYDSNNNPVNTQDDWHGTDSNGVTWTDHPIGVQSNMKYEYMVQRSKLAGQQTWNAYAPSSAALWSKYGENGRDGDGIEYIYACVDDINTNPPSRITSVLDPALANIENGLLQAGANYNITAWKKYPSDTWKYVTDNDYIPPSKKVYHTVDSNYTVAGYYPDTDWTDDPQELNATDKKVEYVAQRKYNGTTKTWSNFSTPEIWAMYGGTGPQGPQGNPGPQGANGTGYKLVNVHSNASYSVTLDSQNNTVINFDTYFTYKIARIVNGEVYYLNAQDRDNFIINGVTYLLYPYVKLKDTTQYTPEDKWYKLTTVSQDPSGETCFYSFGSNGLTTAQKETFINNNQLFEIALIPIARPGSGQSAPTILDPDDYATEINNALDKQEIKLTISSSAQFQIVQGPQASIKALVTGQQGLSELIIGPQGIQSRVDDLEDGFGGIQTQINQMPDEIELNVYDQLYEKTGIDVSTGTITLNANNTIFNGSIKMYNADEGLVVFNDQGQKAVEVVKDSIGTFGNNQNTTNHLSATTKTCTYIAGNNGSYRMYIDQFNTSKEDDYGGYTNETNYYGQTQYLPAVLRLGIHNNGETLIFQNVRWTMEGSYSGNINDYKVKARLFWLNDDHIVSWQNIWSTPNYSNGTFSINLPYYNVTSAGSGYEWTLLLDFKGPNPSNNRSKSFKFNVTADLVNNMSINTKIGTDGYRTVTPKSEAWVDQNQITNLYYGDNTSMYGSNYKLYGTSVDKYGTNNVFGSASIDTNNGTPMSNPSYINIGSVAPLIKVSSSTTTDNDDNRLSGAIGWSSFSNDPVLPRIIVKKSDVHIIPKYILVEGRHPSYSNNYHLIMLNAGTSESYYLPIGTEVIIINHSGGTVYASGYNASGITNLPKCIYDDDTATLYKAMPIENGKTWGFIHVGGGKWKPIQLYGGGSPSPTDF